jgi:hypothetical protein
MMSVKIPESLISSCFFIHIVAFIASDFPAFVPEWVTVQAVPARPKAQGNKNGCEETANCRFSIFAFRIPDFEFGIPNFGFRIPDSGFRISAVAVVFEPGGSERKGLA